MMESLLEAPLTTLLGFIGMAAAVTWPLFKSRNGMLAGQMGVHLFFAAHYFLLGAYTGSLMNGLALLQAGAAVPLERHRAFRLIYILTLPLIAAGALYTWQGIPSIFSSLGLAFISLGRYQTNTYWFRIFLIAAISSWFVHNLVVGSVPGMMADGLSMATSLWMIVKERKRAALAA